jgi:mannose-6-phosphate isomerase
MTCNEALLGQRLVDCPKFPLLNKFVDANALLSVQVHPDEAAAAELQDAEAKTEAWYVIHAEPGATLIKGLKPGITRETFEDAVLNDTVPTVLNSIPVSAGDMVYVPAGCIHAMGKGLLICEIQQNSDTTYRVFDWGRVGADGKPRQLHIDQALQVINFEDDSPDRIHPITISEGGNKCTYLIACPRFAMQTLTLAEALTASTQEKRFESLMVISGNAVVKTEGCDDTTVSMGDTVLVPACAGNYELVPAGGCVLLRVFVPDIEGEIVPELRSKGLSEEEIQAVVFE